MGKRLLAIACLTLAATAAAAWASPPGADARRSAEAACKSLKARIGIASFAQAYGTNATRSNALGRCVASLARVEQQNLDAAVAACKAEQADPNFAVTHGARTFAQFYGAAANGRNALARCIAAKARGSSVAERQARPNPARLCNDLRAGMTRPLFAEAYGTNPNGSNAHGKCVSQLARAQTQAELTAAAACLEEQVDTDLAIANGLTFAQLYGTNGDLSNAFGKCVARKAKAAIQARRQVTVRAAKTCAAERTAGPAVFRNKYTSFKSCVAQLAATG